MHLTLQSLLNSPHPAPIDQLGQWSGCRKVYLTYTGKEGWRIEKFNVFQFLFKKMGLCSKASFNNILKQLKAEIQPDQNIPDDQRNLLTKIKKCWDKNHHTPFPLTIASQSSPFDFTSASEEVCSLLSDNAGMILGEAHTERASMKFMIENMQRFKDHGVTTIFIESLSQDKDAASCKEYFSSSSDELTGTLKQGILYHDVYYYGLVGVDKKMSLEEASKFLEKFGLRDLPQTELERVQDLINQEKIHPYNLTQLFKCANRHGIEVIPIDTLATKNLGDRTEIAKKKNKVFAKAIRKYAQGNHGKYLLHCGQAHAMQYKHIKGMNKRLNLPVVIFREFTDKRDESLEKNNKIKIEDSSGDITENIDYGISFVC